MRMRRSGRTTSLLRSALELTRGHRTVTFVVWNHAHIGMVYDMLHRDGFIVYRGDALQHLQVVTYEMYKRDPERYPLIVYDHYVTECLAEKAGYCDGRDMIEVYLRIGNWYQRRAVDVECYSHGNYRMAVHEPMAAQAWGNRCDVDGSVTMSIKTVTFVRTHEIKDGLVVFSDR